MKPKDQDKDLIYEYITRQLTDAEMEVFRRKMDDPDFSGEVRLQQDIARAVNEVYKNELRSRVKDNLEKIRINRDLKVSPVRWYLVAAAAVLLAVCIFLTKRTDATTTEVFMTYYQVFPAFVETRGDEPPGAPAASSERNISRLYAQGQFDKVAGILQSDLDSIANSYDRSYFKFILGICYIELHESDKARITLTEVAQHSTEGMLNDHAEWYAALACLQSGDLPLTRIRLREIVGSGSMYELQAEKMLKDLEDVK